jgi:hypothetical protein
MSAYSQYQSAQYNAQVARNNQTIAQQNSSIALQQGQTQEENQRLKTGGMVAGIEAQQAASGVNANTGSSVDVRSSAAETGELDALTIRYNSNLQARNFTQAANSYGAQASLDEAQGEWGVAGSILGGASSVSGKWLQYQQSGVGAGTSLPSSYYNLPSFNVGG